MYIHIDSSHIDKKERLIISDKYILNKNPLKIEQNILWIKNIFNQNLLNKNIILSGIEENIIILKTLIKTEDNYIPSIEFINDYLKINCNPIMNKNYDRDIYVEISGFKSNIGNISFNDLNRCHKIIYHDINSFLVKLNNNFDNSDWHNRKNSYNISLKFKHYGGIPINLLESRYIVKYNQDDRIGIELPYEGSYCDDFGGDYVGLSVISDIKRDSNNDYHIDLGKRIKVKQIEIINGIFTKNIYNITNNNIFYYQFIDIDNILSITFPPGYYTIDKFIDYFNKNQKENRNININIFVNNNVTFKSEYKFRIRMDFSNSIDILGFRNIGLPGSITEYGKVINNNDLYEGEYCKDIICPQIKFNNEGYILMLLNNFNNINTVNTNINFFTKIIPNNHKTLIVPNKIILDTEQEISCLDIKFINNNGDVIYFEDDHSIILSLLQ